MSATQLTHADVTKAPKTKPTFTRDGVSTGLRLTLARSVAMLDGGEVRWIPIGTLITGPICGGEDYRLGCRYDARKTTDNVGISYRA